MPLRGGRLVPSPPPPPSSGAFSALPAPSTASWRRRAASFVRPDLDEGPTSPPSSASLSDPSLLSALAINGALGGALATRSFGTLDRSVGAAPVFFSAREDGEPRLVKVDATRLEGEGERLLFFGESERLVLRLSLGVLPWASYSWCVCRGVHTAARLIRAVQGASEAERHTLVSEFLNGVGP